MAEETLKRNLHAAFDPGQDFPHPLLLSRTMAILDAGIKIADRHQDRSIHHRAFHALPRRSMEVVAAALMVLLAVAAVGIFVAINQYAHRSVPAQPPQAPSNAAACPLPSGAQPPNPGPPPDYYPDSNPPHLVKMVGPTAAWAEGGLYTTDNGAHWRDLSPAVLRSDQPRGQSKTLLPPSFADFYLDANHAWEARSFSSTTSCFDHIWTFATSNGGQTWQQSGPVVLDVPGSELKAIGIQLFFVDPHNGWLWVLTFGRNSEGAGVLYGTSDGGLHWHLISNITAPSIGVKSSEFCLRPLGGGVAFASPTTGWMTTCDIQPALAQRELLTTHDGGTTWKVQVLPGPAGMCPCSVGTPMFFNDRSGIVKVWNSESAGTNTPSLFATHDGGNTWQPLPALPSTECSQPDHCNGDATPSLNFMDANNFWDLVFALPPKSGARGRQGGSLYRSTDGGQTWRLVQANVLIGNGPLSTPLVTLVFVDDQHGIAAAGSELYATADGGHTWKLTGPQIEASK